MSRKLMVMMVRTKPMRTAVSWILFLAGVVLGKFGDIGFSYRCLTLSAAWQVPTGFVDATSVSGPYPLPDAEEIVALAEAEGWDPRALQRLLT